jgi:hypothetical protein
MNDNGCIGAIVRLWRWLLNIFRPGPTPAPLPKKKTNMAREKLTNGGFATDLSSWTNEATGDGFTAGTVDWVWAATGTGAAPVPVSANRARVIFAGVGFSKILRQAVTLKPGTYRVTFTGTTMTSGCNVTINLYDGIGGYTNIPANGNFGSQFVPAATEVVVPSEYAYVGIQIENTDASPNETYLDLASILTFVTVDAPDGFRPVGTGELVYTFTESVPTDEDYESIDIELNGLSLPVSRFSTFNGVTECDIAPWLRSVLRMSPTVADRFKNTYVKYTVNYDGGSYTQVPLSSNVIYFYTGTNNLLNARTQFHINSSGGSFLARSPLYVANGRTAYLDFLHNGSLSANSMVLVKGQTSAYADVLPLHTFDGTVNNMETGAAFKPLSNTSAQVRGFASRLAINEGDVTNTPKLYFGSADVGQGFAQTFTAGAGPGYMLVAFLKTGSPTYTMTFKILGTSAGLPNESDVKATVTLNLAQTGYVQRILLDFSAFTFVNATVYALQIIPNNDGVGTASHYYSVYTSNASTYAGGSVSNKAAGVWTNDANKDLFCSFLITSTTYATIAITTLNECANPIYLKWLNDFGGISTRLFDYNQIFNMVPSDADDGRFKKLIVFLQSLTQAAWIDIEELNRPGAEFGDNQKLGAWVVDFTDESNEINIFVEPNPASTLTKARGNNCQLVLRYPLIENIGVSS